MIHTKSRDKYESKVSRKWSHTVIVSSSIAHVASKGRSNKLPSVELSKRMREGRRRRQRQLESESCCRHQRRGSPKTAQLRRPIERRGRQRTCATKPGGDEETTIVAKRRRRPSIDSHRAPWPDHAPARLPSPQSRFHNCAPCRPLTATTPRTPTST